MKGPPVSTCRRCGGKIIGGPGVNDPDPKKADGHPSFMHTTCASDERQDMHEASQQRLHDASEDLLSACIGFLGVYDALTANGAEPHRPIVFGKKTIAAIRDAVAKAKGEAP